MSNWVLIIRGSGRAFSQGGPHPQDVDQMASAFVASLYAAGHDVKDGRAFAGIEKDLREQSVAPPGGIQDAANKVFNNGTAKVVESVVATTEPGPAPKAPSNAGTAGTKLVETPLSAAVVLGPGAPYAVFGEAVRSMRPSGPAPKRLTAGTIVRDVSTKQLGVVMMAAGAPGIPEGYAVAFEASRGYETFRWELRRDLEVIAVPE